MPKLASLAGWLRPRRSFRPSLFLAGLTLTRSYRITRAVKTALPIPPEVMREKRMRASRASLKMTHEEGMEQIFRNGSPRNPNLWKDGRWTKGV